MRRLIRKASWESINPNDSNTIQLITDAMASQAQIQINYQNSGWRMILPYSWKTSKNGDILLMCYKDTGEVRSYRFDKIEQILVDDGLLMSENDDSGITMEIKDYDSVPDEFKLPDLPNEDELLELSENEVGQELPFDGAIDALINETGQNTYENNPNESLNDIQEVPIEENEEGGEKVEDNQQRTNV